MPGIHLPERCPLRQFARPAFALVTARDGGQLGGFAFGYALSSGDSHWWGGVLPESTTDFLQHTGSRTWVFSPCDGRSAGG